MIQIACDSGTLSGSEEVSTVIFGHVPAPLQNVKNQVDFGVYDSLESVEISTKKLGRKQFLH